MKYASILLTDLKICESIIIHDALGKEETIMLAADEAKKIGIRACIDAIGRKFYEKHGDNSVYSYGQNDGWMNCFVGVSDQPDPSPKYKLSEMSSFTLTDGNNWPYYAFCDVDMESGKAVLGEVKSPELKLQES